MGWRSGRIGAESRRCLIMQNRRAYPLQTLICSWAFYWEELQGYTAVMDTLKKAGSVRAASDAVLTGYEKPADQSETAKKSVQSTARDTIKVCSRKRYKVLQSAQELDGRSKPAGGVYVAGKCKERLQGGLYCI